MSHTVMARTVSESDLKHDANLLPRYYLLTDYLLINVFTVKPRVTVWCDEAVLCFVLKGSGCVRFQLLHWRLLPGNLPCPWFGEGSRLRIRKVLSRL